MASLLDEESKDNQLVNAFKMHIITTDFLVHVHDMMRPGKAVWVSVSSAIAVDGLDITGVIMVDSKEPGLRPFVREMSRRKLDSLVYWLIVLKCRDAIIPLCLNIWGCLSPRILRKRIGDNAEMETVEPVDDGIQANDLTQEQFLALKKGSQATWISARLDAASGSQDTALSLEQYVKRIHEYRVVFTDKDKTGYITQIISAGPKGVEIRLLSSTVGRTVSECKTVVLGNAVGVVADGGSLAAKIVASVTENIVKATLRVAINDFASDLELKVVF